MGVGSFEKLRSVTNSLATPFCLMTGVRPKVPRGQLDGAKMLVMTSNVDLPLSQGGSIDLHGGRSSCVDARPQNPRTPTPETEGDDGFARLEVREKTKGDNNVDQNSQNMTSTLETVERRRSRHGSKDVIDKLYPKILVSPPTTHLGR